MAVSAIAVSALLSKFVYVQRASRPPASIRWYLYLAVIGLAVGSLGNLLSPTVNRAVPQNSVMVALSVLLNGVLIVGVWRFRSNAARWIFAVWLALAGLMFLVGIIFYPSLIPKFSWGEILESLITVSANLGAVACLFTREAGEWFKDKRPATD